MSGIADYEIEAELGHGGMGRVYRARYKPTGVTRALKVLEGAPDPEMIERFRREAESLARAGGDGVVAVHDAGIERGRAWLSMELMTGGSLRDRLRAGNLDWRDAAAVVARVARTLERCASMGLVHRDVKPDNVLFDETGAPRLADFGCVRDVGRATITVTGAMVGTPAYLAPELAQGAKPDPSVDVYALGVVLHELIAGSRPFDGASPVAILTAALDGKRTDLTTFGAPAELDALVGAALGPREKRPRAGEVARALEELMHPRVAPPSRGRFAALAAIAALACAAPIVAYEIVQPGRPEQPPPAPPVAPPTEPAPTARAPLPAAGSLPEEPQAYWDAAFAALSRAERPGADKLARHALELEHREGPAWLRAPGEPRPTAGDVIEARKQFDQIRAAKDLELPQRIERYAAARAYEWDNGWIWYDLAGCERDAGRLDEAIRDARRAIQLLPDHPMPSHVLGDMLFRKKKLREAVEAYTAAEARFKRDDTDAVYTHIQRGNCLFLLGSDDAAAKDFERVRELAKSAGRTGAFAQLDDEAARKLTILSKWAAAEAEIAAARASLRVPDGALAKEAVAACQRKEWAKALALARLAFQKLPADRVPLELFGVRIKAEAALSTRPTVPTPADEEKAEADNERCRELSRQPKATERDEAFRAATEAWVRHAWSSPEVLAAHALSCIYLDDDDDAIEFASWALVLDPRCPNAHFTIGWAKLELSEKALDPDSRRKLLGEAIASFDAAITHRRPPSAEDHLERAIAEEALSENPPDPRLKTAAARDYSRYLELGDPAHPDKVEKARRQLKALRGEDR